MNSKHAVVIGAGLGGIASALRLKAKGYNVTLLDRLDQLGGRARVFKQDGFTFDAGPTVVTAPFLIDEIYELFGKKRKDYINLVEVEPWYRFLYNDGTYFDYGSTIEHTRNEISKFSKSDVDGYDGLLAESKKIFEIGFEQLSDEPFHKLSTFASTVPDMIRLRAYRNVYQLVSAHLQHPKLRRAFSIQPLLVGGNPFDTTCIYNLIHYLERKWGIHYAMGGTGAIVNGLEKLMREEGINIRLNADVKQLHGNKHINSVELSTGEYIDADMFICNSDPAFTYKNMVPQLQNKKWSPKKIEKMDYSMGLYVIYFGTNKLYSDVKHHTIIMGDSYKGLLESIFHSKELRFDDVSLYLHRPTATDSTMAPDGNECFYVLSPVPNLKGKTNWEDESEKFKNFIYERLEQTCLPNLRQHIVTEKVLHPGHFEKDYKSQFGSGFSIAPTLKQSAYLRFHNKSEDFNNLYFVGAGTHPGAGMPGVICSAKVLDKLVPNV